MACELDMLRFSHSSIQELISPPKFWLFAPVAASPTVKVESGYVIVRYSSSSKCKRSCFDSVYSTRRKSGDGGLNCPSPIDMFFAFPVFKLSSVLDESEISVRLYQHRRQRSIQKSKA